MEHIYMNAAPAIRTRFSNRTGPRKFLLSAILCLGLVSVFLLAGIATLGFYYVSATKDNLTECVLASEERHRLNARVTVLSEELEKLQHACNLMKTCPARWQLFRSDCYLFSAGSASWEIASQDCREKEADLVVVDSYEEQEFLTATIIQSSWIGLNDREHEGTWKWIDGTFPDSTVAYWSKNQPDNGRGDPKWGEEDCVYIMDRSLQWKASQNWNDHSCKSNMSWICEKMATE
ncbi:CD209 antigen-like protein E [Parambassis ranga]|uniref:CD209 antigen-like protein E n=1 Tax=Parambassis ranga TaxID=210632 RepID=A0A6P7HNV4_9TELE|nr:CD209 antigen-like protein E [Parambassis ranga]